MEEKYTMFTFEVPDDLYADLEKLAEDTGKSKEVLVQQAIEKFLEDMRDYLIAQKEEADIKSGHV